VESLSAAVRVMPHRQQQIEVTVGGTDEVRKGITVRQQGAQVVVRGTGAGAGGRGTTVVQTGPGFRSVTRVGRGSVVINSGGNMSIVNGQVFIDGKPMLTGNADSESADDLPEVLVKVPYGTAVTIDQVEEGPITIGDVRGKIDLSLESASARVQSTTGGRVETHGNGSAVIDDASGDDLTLSCHANGGITVSAGHVETLTCLSHANGPINVYGSATESRLESHGNGPVYLQTSRERPTIKRWGNGSVHVGNHPNA
jgi:hypothetical protein